MALPSVGNPLSFSQIRTELSAASTNVSLRSMSSTAGTSTPDAVSEFYGYSNNSAPLRLYGASSDIDDQFYDRNILGSTESATGARGTNCDDVFTLKGEWNMDSGYYYAIYKPVTLTSIYTPYLNSFSLYFDINIGSNPIFGGIGYSLDLGTRYKTQTGGDTLYGPIGNVDIFNPGETNSDINTSVVYTPPSSLYSDVNNPLTHIELQFKLFAIRTNSPSLSFNITNMNVYESCPV